MRKYLYTALAAFLALWALFTGWQYLRINQLQIDAQAAHTQAEEALAALARERAASAALRKAQRAAQTRAAQAQKELDHVLKQDRDWAAAPVPDATAQWLRDNGFAAPAPGAAGAVP